MARTRTALLQAAGECLARYGIRKTTMVDVAARSKVAKATLYNHFRTKDDLLVAYVEERVADLVRAAVATASTGGLGAALEEVATVLADDPVLRRAASQEPASLAPLAAPSETRGWELARTGVADVLVASRVPSTAADVDLVLRWLVSQLLWQGAKDGSVEVLVRALGGASGPAPAVDAPDEEPVPALGWPRI